MDEQINWTEEFAKFLVEVDFYSQFLSELYSRNYTLEEWVDGDPCIQTILYGLGFFTESEYSERMENINMLWNKRICELLQIELK